jgi:uncharacterized protein YecE (DUF72 family)
MSPDNLHNLHLGTSSWTFADWRDVFYPSQLPTKEQLNYYATQFNSVEVNTSFYGLPAPSTVLQWVESVPPGFTFALKAPRQITHEKKLIDCRQEVQAYLDVLRSLGDLVAPGFLQFPPQFTRAQHGRVLANFLDWVAGELNGLRLAVEVRSRDLMTEAFARFLADRAISFVVVERIDTPDLYENWVAQLAVETAPRTLFLRIIGNDQDKLPNDRDLQRPQDEILDRWAERIADLLAQNIEVFAYIHNPFEGHSPASARRLPVWSPPPASPVEGENSGQLPLL